MKKYQAPDLTVETPELCAVLLGSDVDISVEELLF